MPEPGKIAYEAYVDSVGGVSVRGETLPGWADQSDKIRVAWNAAADAVLATFRD